ncbi:nucleotide exchange factor GrpE [Reichenbachiella sp. MALMAid0571]|uniref:nucleotide exchange factor GrpE n=1 Tax=Reichenbachiella sp. MALMAid0571 TaxID=3143939 RepID=UPI0032DF63E6
MAKAKIDEQEKDNSPEEVSEKEQPAKKEAKKKKSQQDELKIELAEAKDKYLRLYSEFENFRRRTAKEKLELVGTANEGLMHSLLPILDDFERADKSYSEEMEVKAMKEGIDLIHSKFKNVLEQKGIKKIEVEAGADFDTELHEAITQIPAPEEKLKGKIVDVIENGYLLSDKVVRFAKVVTGA